MSCCPGCQKVFRTEAALYSHQRQTKKTRCRQFYASSSHGSQPSDLDHISDIDLKEDFGFDSSSESRIPTEPQGDYFGNYDDDYDPSHAHWTSPLLSPSFLDIDPILPLPTTVDSDGDTDDLEFAATALECEGGWEPNPDNVDHRHLSPSLSASPVQHFTPSPLSSRSSSLQSSRSTSPSMVISEADESHDDDEPASPVQHFTPSPLSSRSSSLQSSRSTSPSMVISEADESRDDEEPIFANLTPYRRLFYNNPFILHFPNPLAGAPVSIDNSNYQQSMNEIYQRRLGETHTVYAPFSSEVDWEIARWAKIRGPTSTAFSDLLNIPGVRDIYLLVPSCMKRRVDKLVSCRLLKNLACRTLTRGNSMKSLI
jgi:hypothetical protein